MSDLYAAGLDLWADLNAEDAEGYCWSLLREATDATAIVPGAILIAGTETFWAVVRIGAVDDDGMVHFTVLHPQDPTSKALLPKHPTVDRH